MKKFYRKKIYLLICLLFSICLVYSQDLPGNVWLLNTYSVVSPGRQFCTSVHVNTGTQKLSTYGFELTHQAAVLTLEAVVAGPDGFVGTGAANTPGTVVLRGFDAAGKGPGTNLNVVQVQWKAADYGITPLNLIITNLADPDNKVIGSPAGINGKIAVVNPNLAYGDTDGNGAVNIVDALMVAQYYVGLIQTFAAPAQADVNADGSIDIVDALVIARYYVGLMAELPVVAGLTHANLELVPDYPGGIKPINLSPTQGNISVRLRDAAGAPVAGKTITFSGDQLYITSRTAQTDSTGLAAVVANIPMDGGWNYDTATTAAFAGDAGFAPVSCQVQLHVYSPAMPTPPSRTPTRTPTPGPATPTPAVTPHADYFHYSPEYNSPDNAVIFDDGENYSPAYMYLKEGFLDTTNSVSGYTGGGYIECYDLPTTMAFWAAIHTAGNYAIGIRIYNTATSSWVFVPVQPVSYSFEPGIYTFAFKFTRKNTLVDRIVIYPVGTAESAWQDLARIPNVSISGSNGPRVTFTIQ